MTIRESWDRKKIIVNIFAYAIALDFVNEDSDPKSVTLQQRSMSPKNN